MDLNRNVSLESILNNKYVMLGGLIAIVFNLIVLNVFLFQIYNQPKISQTPSQQNPCTSCEARLNEAFAKIQNIETALSGTPKPSGIRSIPTSTPAPTVVPTAVPTATPTPRITDTPTPTVTVAGVKEYYILFGSGNSSASDWSDVSGLQASIDTALYPTIKTSTFEVTGHTPTGNEIVWVRLYNSTDKYPMPNSEVTWAGGGSQSVSSPVTLISGNKTYKVQMKTQLSYPSYIDSAKIHLILY